MSKKIIEYYKQNCLYSHQNVVYQQVDSSGYGNQCRGMLSCFLLALILKRRFILDCCMIQTYFESPVEFDWNKKNIDFADILKINPLVDKNMLNIIENSNLDMLKNTTTLLHYNGNAFVIHLLNNIHLKDILYELFNTNLNNEITPILTNILLNNPKNIFLDKINEKKKYINFADNNRFKIVIQYRTFYDIGSTNMNIFPIFIKYVEDTLEKQYKIKNPQIFVATDNLNLTKNIVEKFSKIGYECIFNNSSIIHTNIIKTNSNDMISINPMIDWWLIGECNTLFTTFTTFSIFASARTDVKDIHIIRNNFCGKISTDEYNY